MNWKDAALAKAEAITDAWEVVKAYAGRAAEWVLFVCMIVNIIEMLPGVLVAQWVLNLVLGVQVVMLDIGGMSLSSMALHAKERGDEAAAKSAGITSKFLIGLMIVTLLLVAAGVLFPSVKPTTDLAEKGLILVRVIMTVVYGHVLHTLRSSSHPAVPVMELQIPSLAVPSSTELESVIKTILVPVLEQYHTKLRSEIAGQKQQLPSVDYAQLAAALQNSAHVQEGRQPSLTAGKPRVRQTPIPLAEGSSQRDARLATAYRELLQEGIKPTGQTLSARARCNRAAALLWLKKYGMDSEGGGIEEVSLEKQA
jgi:hypothetical protein